MKAKLAIDTSGYPVMLSVPIRTGEPATTVEATRPIVDALELARRGDAVREAAREFEDLSEQDLRERLRGATSRPLDVTEIAQFRDDVRAQVLSDVIDVLDQNRRGKLRSRRTVRVVAPKGYTRKAISGLSAQEQSDVEDRLRARGWTDQDVLDVLGKRAEEQA